MTKLFEGVVCPITITLDHDATNVIVHLVEKTKRNIIAKFSYPERDGYVTLSNEGRVYSGVLTAEKTINKSNEEIVIEIREFINDELKPIGEATIVDNLGNPVRLSDNSVKNIT
jgi:hypothetical protein